MLLSVFLCIFFSKSLLFLCLTVQYLILGRLETATISQLSFNMQVSIIFPRHVSTLPVNLFLRLLKPRLTALPRFRACTVQKTASRGRCWLTFQRKLLAGCFQDSWKQTGTLFFFGRSNQNEKTVLDLSKLFFRVFCHLISPKAWIQLGNLSHASLEPFADPQGKDARRAARVII